MPPRDLRVVDDDVGIRPPDDELSIAFDDLPVGEAEVIRRIAIARGTSVFDFDYLKVG